VSLDSDTKLHMYLCLQCMCAMSLISLEIRSQIAPDIFRSRSDFVQFSIGLCAHKVRGFEAVQKFLWYVHKIVDG
jgi:hypothetical protein